MISTLCALALTSISPEIKPLPGERALQSREQVVLAYARIRSPELGLIGWTRTEVHKGEVDGRTQYLVVRSAELAPLQRMAFGTMEQRGLYTEDLHLIQERQRSVSSGSEAVELELRWEDDGFRWREGRGKWTAVEGARRVTAETDVALLVRGLSIDSPWEGYVFDPDRRTVEARTLRRGAVTDEEEFEGTTFLVEAQTPQRHQVRSDGGFFRTRMEGVDVEYAVFHDDLEVELREELAENEVLETMLAERARASWEQDAQEFGSALLGLSLELPKGWRRLPKLEADSVQFYAISAEEDAYVMISTTLLGSGYSFEDWVEGLESFYAEQNPGQQIKRSKKKFARQSAVRFEFVANDLGLELETTAYGWKRHGIGALVAVGSSSKAPKKVARAVAELLKTVKVE
ncbi:MAG: hypothetical protein AAGB93_19845 [Planctomycetota bacterium]